MRTGKKGTGWSQLWKRNAVVAAIAPVSYTHLRHFSLRQGIEEDISFGANRMTIGKGIVS